MKLGKNALIIGASMAGLLAARAAADYFDNVTLIERDTLPESASIRNGVPQGKHVHVLMIRGQQILERFFPGLAAHLDSVGVPYVRWMADANLYLSDGWLKRNDLNITTRTTTRPTLEWIVRQELAKLDNIQFVQNCLVHGLITDVSRTRIIGVEVSYRRGTTEQTDKPETLAADFVVDASGRHSRMPEWLRTIDYEAPAETQVNSRLAYASRLYSKLSYEPDWKIMGINAKGPDQPRAGGITLQEGGRWMVSLFGYGSQNQPSTDPDEFLAFARTLPCPDLYNAIKTGTPSTDISGYADTVNTWQHYERLQRLPIGLSILGDATCCFNPVYAQGMTTAALAAETLEGCLSQIETVDALGMQFQKRLAKVIASPWLLATGIDFQFTETQGPPPGIAATLAQGYLERLLAIIHDDPQIASAFIQVMNMLKSPMALFNPSLVIKVLSRSANNKFGNTHPVGNHLAGL